jgi:orotidine-5'-phosphate decarboxylase
VTAPRLVVALDVPSAREAMAAAETLQGSADVLKIGLELFTAEGPALVRRLAADGWGIFLDLKVHDIPATAARTVSVAVDLGVELLTLHASGGPSMLAAAAAARGAANGPRLLGVTVLTSLGAEEVEAIGWRDEPAALVTRLCALAHDAGCDGVVCSVLEAARVKQAHGPGFVVVTPGIRPRGSASDDQARVATPADAVRAGADYLVVGRPILRAEDPAAAARAIAAEMAAAHEES